jgi:hypothetical protein
MSYVLSCLTLLLYEYDSNQLYIMYYV